MSSPDKAGPNTHTNHVAGHPDAPSSWVVRWTHLAEPGASVLDLACGGGRHLAWFEQQGHRVTGVDVDTTAAQARLPEVELICADLEQAPWPLTLPTQPTVARQFGVVVVTNYLWRPLWPHILDSVAPGGLLIYETFAAGNESLGRPKRPDFLLQPEELLRVCANWHIVAYENGTLEAPPRCVQRIAAVRKGGVNASASPQLRYAL